MEIMNLSSLRRTFFILFSVMGLFLVLSCFVSTEDYFSKQTRLVQSAYDRTTHNLMTAARTTRQSLTLRRTTERRDRTDYLPFHRSTTDPAVTTMKNHSQTTVRKSVSISRNWFTVYGEIYGTGKFNTTEGGEDNVLTLEKFVRNPRVRPVRIGSKRETSSKVDTDTKNVVGYHHQNFTENRHPLFGKIMRNPKLRPLKSPGNTSSKADTNIEASNEDLKFPQSRNLSSLIASNKTYLAGESAAKENKEDDGVLLAPMETREKPVAHKNTFLSKKYKNIDLIEDFKHLLGGNAEDAEEILEKKPWEVAKVYPVVERRESRDKDARRKYFEQMSKRTMRFARGFKDPNYSVLRKVQWQPHFDNHSYNYLITPYTNCHDYKGDYADVTLFVFILTSPIHYSHRRVIRRSWMAQAQREHLDMKIIFLLGATDDMVVQHYIDDEAKQYRDILQEDFHDSYVNLTLKTIMGLKWSTQSCPKAKFVMKVDDDVAVNVVDLMAYLKNVNASEGFIGGIVTKGAAPYRNSRKKWYVPEDVYPDPTYPPYPQGKSYVMTMDVARKLFKASKEIEIFPWEDVFIGLCLQRIGMPPSEIPGFDGAGAIFSAKREIWRDDGALKILQQMLIVYDLQESQIETISHVWRYKEWPKEK